MSTSPPQSPDDGSVKLILNGDIPADVLNRLCEQIEYRRANDLEIPNTPELIRILNSVENLVFYAERRFLEGIGFHGPWPNALRIKPADATAMVNFCDAQNS